MRESATRSKIMAMINMVMERPPHVPPNQWWTALYQRKVYGINKNPKMGQTNVSKSPLNQPVAPHKIRTTIRGKNRLTRVKTIGI
jgi:hypothetical protein